MSNISEINVHKLTDPIHTGYQVLNLEPGQVATVPANLVHRTRPAGARSVNLTVERGNTETILAEPQRP
jgi:hypothetical protein